MKAKQAFPSFEVVVTTLPSSGFPARLRPGEAERAAVAAATGVDAFELLEADILVRRWRRDGVEISGEVRADLVQPCVVTLEPVRQSIREAFSSTFLPEGSKLSKPARHSGEELVLAFDGDDPPETFSGDAIDLWPVVAEWLNLAIDRFPRSSGAEFAEPTAAKEEDDARPSPFAALARLAKGDK